MNDAMKPDVLVIGSGLGGLAAAWDAAKRGCAVTLLTRASNPQTATRTGAGRDYLSRERRVTRTVGRGHPLGWRRAQLSRGGVAAQSKGPRLVKEILIDEIQVPFDPSPAHPGELDLTSEAGHSLQRIIHYKDQTGFAMSGHSSRGFVPTECKSDLERYRRGSTDGVASLGRAHGRLSAADMRRCLCSRPDDGKDFSILAKETILASGGLGSVFLHTTNPPGARGDGIAMAYRAGPAASPAVHTIPSDRVACAGRLLPDFGDGAWRRRPPGRSPWQGIHAAVPSRRLARPRDVAARAIYQTMLESGEPCVYLDITHKPADLLRERFPSIYAVCLERGIDSRANPSRSSLRPITVAAALRRTILAGPPSIA